MADQLTLHQKAEVYSTIIFFLEKFATLSPSCDLTVRRVFTTNRRVHAATGFAQSLVRFQDEKTTVAVQVEPGHIEVIVASSTDTQHG